jgi:hypothetical protein
MNESPPGRSGAAGAGVLLVAAVIVFTLVGLALGALIGAPAPLAILGGGVGLVAGFWLVYSRFRDI